MFFFCIVGNFFLVTLGVFRVESMQNIHSQPSELLGMLAGLICLCDRRFGRKDTALVPD
jgi:hypothetical protein